MLSSSVIDVPRPLIDPINSLAEALSIVSLAVQRPRRDTTVVLAVDEKRRGIHLFRTNVMSATTAHHIVRECSYVPAIDGVVIVSHRTSAPIAATDKDVWNCSRLTLSAAGISLIDWVIVGAGGLYCPRTLSGVSDPWPYCSTCV